ncbi:PDZ domain-containing protein [Thermodesulfobium sp. 4217-1]|uniref:PDZ domain-containing protein n=1 Tax=Thermodesulfobium sp. 4217-1 TaxID=3120013 RepID=UPI003222198B
MRAKILIFLFAFLMIFSSVSFAVELNSKDLQWEPKWYKPQVLSSVELAKSILTNLMASQKFSTWLGYIPTKIDADKYGLRVFGVYGDQQETSVINLTEVRDAFIYYLPNLDRDFKWCVVVVLSHQDPSFQYFRTQDLETAQKLSDVISTFALAAGSKLYTPTGIDYFVDEKKMDKLKKDTCWSENYGAFVESVESTSPADTAGFKPNDIITEVNGEKVKDNMGFVGLIQNGVEGKESAQFNVKVYRNKTFLNLSMTVPNFNYGKEKLVSDTNQQKPQILSKASLGIDVKSISYSTDTGETYNGLKVLNIKPNGLAEESGIKVGDIILEINDKPVRDIPSMASIISNEMPIKFKVLRNGEILTLDAAQSF